MRVQLLLLLFWFFSPLAAMSAEEERVAVDSQLQMELADYFFQEGDYYRAITEYKRFLFLSPKCPYRGSALENCAILFQWEEMG